MPHEDFILKGAPLEGIPDCSLGEYILGKMRAFPQDKTIQVDADTGAVQTVGELLAMGIRLAEGLRQLGVKENDVVGLMSRNCFETCGVVLGTWLCGATIAPSPGTMTIAEFKHILGITKPKIIFCEEGAVTNITAALSLLLLPSKVILVESTQKANPTFMRFQEVLADADLENYKPPPVKSPSSQLATILPSSGTSGLPKGVGISHRNLIFQDFNMDSLEGFQAESFLQISQFFWVTGVITFLRCLTTGLIRVLLRDPTVPNLLKAIDQFKPEASMAAPLYVLALTTNPDFEKFDVSSMKTFLVGGSLYTPSIGEKIKEKWPEVRVLQLYGTTEVSGTVCCNTEGDPYALGKVTSGVQVKVIDNATGEALKPNALGEILIKSPGLMSCYVGNEEAYRDAVDADGWFHTGDIGYHNDSGQLYLVDRMKEMVKIRDMQVAPLEVENAILAIPEVLEVAVSGVTRDGQVFELLAVVVKDKNSTLTEDDIHAHIANTLSDFKKLTGGIYFVESLEKTASGKINRNKLKALAQRLYTGQ